MFHQNPFSGSPVVFKRTDEEKNKTRLKLLYAHKNSFNIDRNGTEGSQTVRDV